VENAADQLPGFPFLVYLRVVEQLVTAVQDPLIRESALGVALPDTGARSQVTWQALPLQFAASATQRDPGQSFDQWVADQTAVSSHLAAQVEKPAGTEDNPCLIAPDAAYRGPENQLYRVEIHTPGDASTATFKWSRDNGSVAFPITAVDGRWVSLSSLGRDDKLAIEVGDWVEVVDDATTARRIASALLRVDELDPAGGRVLLSAAPTGGQVATRHPLLRRWDQQTPGLRAGATPVTEGAWINLEDGVQVQFQAGGDYRTGDYWLIPARTLTADLEWPRDAAGRPLLLPPAGPVVRYAPLAWITGDESVNQLRRTFQPLPNA
jgi:hypothetical protein